jgi:hypothetical protein
VLLLRELLLHPPPPNHLQLLELVDLLLPKEVPPLPQQCLDVLLSLGELLSGEVALLLNKHRCVTIPHRKRLPYLHHREVREQHLRLLICRLRDVVPGVKAEERLNIRRSILSVVLPRPADCTAGSSGTLLSVGLLGISVLLQRLRIVIRLHLVMRLHRAWLVAREGWRRHVLVGALVR